jgi:hypothetical protein
MRDNKGFVCHDHTSMVSYELHHIWPLGYHGPDIPGNKAKVCPNAHSDIHYLMERLFRGKPVNYREYGPNVRDLARWGYEQVIAYAEDLSKVAGHLS